MGTIKCEYCGKHIQDNIRICPFCNGSVITESTITNEVYAVKERARTKKKKIIIVILLIVIVLAVVIISIVSIVNANTLTYEELSVYNIIYYYKNGLLKDPDSLQLHGKAVYIVDKEHIEYVFFEASANNSFGAKVTNIVMFKGEKYIGNFSDKEPASTNDRKDFLSSKSAFTSWQTYGDKLSEQDDYVESVSVELSKIAYKLRCEYIEN